MVEGNAKQDPRIIFAQFIIAAIRIQRNVRAFKHIRERNIDKLKILFSTSGAFQPNDSSLREEEEEKSQNKNNSQDKLNTEDEMDESVKDKEENNTVDKDKLSPDEEENKKDSQEMRKQQRGGEDAAENAKQINVKIEVILERLWYEYQIRSIESLISEWQLDTSDYLKFEQYQRDQHGLSGARVGEAWMSKQNLLGFSEYQAEQLRRTILNYKSIEKEQHDAAHLINNIARQKQARKKVSSIREEKQKEIKQQHQAATKLQGIHRQREAKKQLGEKKELAVDFHIIECMDDMIMKLELKAKGIDFDKKDDKRSQFIENTLGRAAVMHSRLSLKMFSAANLDSSDSSSRQSHSGMNTPSFSDMHSTAPGTPFATYSGGFNTPNADPTPNHPSPPSHYVKETSEERMDRLENLAHSLFENYNYLVACYEQVTGKIVTPPTHEELASFSGLSIDTQARLELLQQEHQQQQEEGEEEEGSHRRKSLHKKDLSQTNEVELNSVINHSLKYNSRPTGGGSNTHINTSSFKEEFGISDKQLSPIESRCISESVEPYSHSSLDGGGSIESGVLFITDKSGNVKRPITPGSPPPPSSSSSSLNLSSSQGVNHRSSHQNNSHQHMSKKQTNLQAEKYKYYVPPKPASPTYYTVEERRLAAKQKHEKEHAELVEQVKAEILAEQKKKSTKTSTTSTSSPSSTSTSIYPQRRPTSSPSSMLQQQQPQQQAPGRRSRSPSPAPMSTSQQEYDLETLSANGRKVSRKQRNGSRSVNDESNPLMNKSSYGNNDYHATNYDVPDNGSLNSGVIAISPPKTNQKPKHSNNNSNTTSSLVRKQPDFIPIAERNKKHNPQADKYIGYIPPPFETPTYHSKEARRQAAKELHEKKKLLRKEQFDAAADGSLYDDGDAYSKKVRSNRSPRIPSPNNSLVGNSDGRSKGNRLSSHPTTLPDIHANRHHTNKNNNNRGGSGTDDDRTTEETAVHLLHSYEEEEDGDSYSLNGHLHNIDQREFYDKQRLSHIRNKQYKYANYQPPEPDLTCHTKQDIQIAAKSLHEKLTELKETRPKSSDRRKRLEQDMIENGNALNSSLNSETIRNMTMGANFDMEAGMFSQTR